MSTVELKKQLREKIEELNENEILEQLLAIIELESIRSEPFKIPEEHKQDIELGLKQIKEGKTISHDKVMSKYKSWD